MDVRPRSNASIIKVGNKDYELKEYLGKGAFAKVWHAHSEEHGDIAVKVINLQSLDKTKLERVTQEIKIHSSLRHRSILNFYGHFREKSVLYLVLEYCANRDLQQYLDLRGRLTEEEACEFMWQIVEGVVYLHGQNIIHRDLKLKNILLTIDRKVKIADFGLATRLFSPYDKQTTMCGTPNYIAPEIAKNDVHGFPADVWSLGVILYTLLVGKPPFDAETVRRTLENVKEVSYDMPVDLSSDAQTLIRALLTKDPEKRIRLEDILKHPFFKPNRHYGSIKMFSQNLMDSGVGSTGMMSTMTGSNVTCSNHQEHTAPCLSSSRSSPVYSQKHSHYRSLDNISNSTDLQENHTFSQTTCHQPRLRQCSSLQNIISKVSQQQIPGEMRTGGSWSQPMHAYSIEREKGLHQVNTSKAADDQHIVIEKQRYGFSSCCHSSMSQSFDQTQPLYSACQRNGSSTCLQQHNTGSIWSQASNGSGNLGFETTAPTLSCSHAWHQDNNSSCCSHPVNCSCQTNHAHSTTTNPHHASHGCQHVATRNQTSCSTESHPSKTYRGKSLEKPEPLNSARLKPKAERIKNMMFRILRDGEVSVEFLNIREPKTSGIDSTKKSLQITVKSVCRISSDGRFIKIYEVPPGTPLSSDPPPLPDTGLKVFTYEKLPKYHYKEYVCAARFIDLVKAKTPKVILHSTEAKCILMENAPDANFEASFYKGGSITWILGSGKVVEPNGSSYPVDATWTAEGKSREVKSMWEHFWECYRHCFTIEATLQGLEKSTHLPLFPITIGKCRKSKTKAAVKLDENKENIQNSSPFGRNYSQSVRPYPGPTQTSDHGKDAVGSDRYPFRDLTSNQNSTPSTKTENVSKLSNHSQPFVEKQYDCYSSETGTNTSKQSNVKANKLHAEIWQIPNGHVVVFEDGIRLTFMNNSKCFRYVNHGEPKVYEGGSHLPDVVQERVTAARDIIARGAAGCNSVVGCVR